MTRRSDPFSREAVLREEAARWFTAMRGPEAEACRVDFEAWLARDVSHRAAYNRIAETFSLGKRLKPVPGHDVSGVACPPSAPMAQI